MGDMYVPRLLLAGSIHQSDLVDLVQRPHLRQGSPVCHRTLHEDFKCLFLLRTIIHSPRVISPYSAPSGPCQIDPSLSRNVYLCVSAS